VPTLRRWLKTLPKQVRDSRQGLLFLEVAMNVAEDFVNSDPFETDTRLQTALNNLEHKNLDSGEFELITSQLLASRAAVAIYRMDLEATIILCHKALEYVTPDSHYLIAYIQLGLGMAYRYTGLDDQAVEAFIQGISHAKAASNPLLAIAGLNGLAQIYEVRGQLSQAAAVYQEALTLAHGDTERPLSIAGIGILGLAKVARERNELDSALHYVNKSRDLAQLSAMAGLETDALMTLALIFRGQEQWAEAAGALDAAEAIARSRLDTIIFRRIGAFQARLNLAQGEVAKAVHWALANKLTVEDELDENLAIEHLTLVRILLAKDEPGPAIRLLERLMAVSEAVGKKTRLIECLLLSSLTYEQADDSQKALTSLERTLRLARSEGIIQIFLDEGETTRQLLVKYIEQARSDKDSKEINLARQLVDLMTIENATNPVSASDQPLFDPLKERELQILCLIAAGLSYREIAGELFLTEGTVKSYTHQLYGKLGVRRRMEAVDRANDSSLL
jgi:LuxR family maltose regulon positive regulatory protein